MDEQKTSKPWIRTVGLVLLAIIAVYGLIYRDVVSRAKESYQWGETYMGWNDHPEKKTAYFDGKFESEKAKLDKNLANKKISQDEYQKKIESLDYDRDFALEESSLKYAYQWYKDTYELFSPPESKWVRLAREKAPVTLELWKKELSAKNIPYQDTMFE